MIQLLLWKAGTWEVALRRPRQKSWQVNCHACTYVSCHPLQSRSWQTRTWEISEHHIYQMLLCAGSWVGQETPGSNQLEIPDVHKVKVQGRMYWKLSEGHGPSHYRSVTGSQAKRLGVSVLSQQEQLIKVQKHCATENRDWSLFKWLSNPLRTLSSNNRVLLKSNLLWTPGCDQLPFASLSRDTTK